MPIYFILQSEKQNPAPIYVRLRHGRKIDVTIKTGKFINPENFKNRKVTQIRMPRGASAETKAQIIKQNKELTKLNEDLTNIENSINIAINNLQNHEVINRRWLENIVTPQQKTNAPITLVDYFDYYLKVKKTSISPTTAKKLTTFKNRIINFEKEDGTALIQEVNKAYANRLADWCDKMNYAHNTKVQTVKTILTICNHAKDRGQPTHPELSQITKDLKYQNTENIHLNFKELDKIINAKMPNEKLDITRDWLVISCYTAQRVSDFLRFSKEDITEIDGYKFLDIRQQKTDTPVYIPLTVEVIDILNKRNGNFPPLYSESEDVNKNTYNKLIKTVCRIAKINNTVTANMRNSKTNRYELREVPKYKAVTSHIGRRSYATNYYGKIKTSLLISATGHATETQFLRYVGKKGNTNAIELARAMHNLNQSNPTLKVVKRASNE